MLAIFLIVFVSMLGTSLLAPLIPFYAIRLGVTPEYITLIMALYALCQFLAAPLWGRISDAHGRKPVLLLTVAGTAVGFVMLAYADTVWMLVLARIVGGVSAGNLAAAYAYVSDITTPENRSAGLGKIGAAFGLGFVLGPGIGGFLAGGDTAVEADFQRPAFAAAAMSVAALLVTALILKETRVLGAQAKSRISLNPFGRLTVVTDNPNLTMTIGLMFLLTTAAAVRESTVAMWCHDHFSLDAREIGLLFAYTGAVITVLQGAAMGVLSKRFGDANTLIIGVTAYALGLTCFMFADDAVLLIIGTTLNSFGTAVFSNGPATLASKLAKPAERGVVLGLNQSAGSLGRFFGPTFAGVLYAQVGHTAPFAVGIVGMIVGLGFTIALKRKLVAAESAG
ncbi:MAG: MFS transporter [Alphaproteobacteria bacterium]|nr:MFS transporter [Alphaproteobacteria bacterium]